MKQLKTWMQAVNQALVQYSQNLDDEELRLLKDLGVCSLLILLPILTILFICQ
jgi:hypothetical protein